MIGKLARLWPRRERAPMPADPWPLTRRLLRLSPRDYFTIGDSVTGVIVTGATGSGKSSGPGEALAKAYLRAGYGGVVHTVKPSDVDTALRWCRETGRTEDVVLFGPGQARMNFLEYELRRPGAGAGLTDNVVDLLLSASEVQDRQSGGGGGGDNAQFFQNAKRQALRAAVDVEVAATGRVSVPGIHRLVTSAPTSVEQFHAQPWRAGSYCWKCLEAANRRAQADGGEQVGGVFRSDLDNAGAFWCEEWPQMADRTRSSVLSSVTGTLDTLNRSYCRELLCTGTTFTPEQLFEGKVVIFTMPTMEFGAIGEMCQVVMKLVVQKAVERRDVRAHPRPVFIAIDEFQRLAVSADGQFALTCRSARGALLLLTQTLPTVHAALGGGDLAKQQTASLFANLNLKVFCANSDSDTTEWASNLMGKSRQFMLNASRQRGGNGGGGLRGPGPGSAGLQEVMELEVQPAELGRLRTGGAANRGVVEAILYRTGTPFRASGRNWMRTVFRQQSA
jgi:hypothetical protein